MNSLPVSPLSTVVSTAGPTATARHPAPRRPALRRVYPSSGAAMHLDVKVTGAGLRLAVGGELDLCTAPRFELWLRRLEDSPRSVSLDLTDVDFTDCAGLLPVLDSARRRLTHVQPPLVLLAMSPNVARVLNLLAEYDVGARELLTTQPPECGGTVWHAGARPRSAVPVTPRGHSWA